ncbi:hypothetical protein HCN44_002708 [Aphidius gifuensis]|uniref:Small ribosomal subunit protein mS31 n=1 Tax=Aphidius gifuensis TaxID=684658 RepID=A0A834XS06_APHGI|nr:28S ribosomal protein S31, mitochondrial [Aphidius gifuensis]KAF7991146.1 hypothetical protein HCN44_002708 [Aphidius gifuensis]
MLPFLRIGSINRCSITHNALKIQQVRLSSNDNDSSSSSDSSDSDNEQVKSTKKIITDNTSLDETKKETANLLNSLLTKMTEEKLVTKTIDFAVPKKKPFLKKEKIPTLEENIQVAARQAASSLGGDVEQKEKDLLGKVFSAGVPGLNETPENLKETPTKSLGEILSGMKVDNTKRPAKQFSHDTMPYSRSAKIQELARKFQNVRKRDGFNETRTPINVGEKGQAADLFGGRPLGIFKKNMEQTGETVTLTTWEKLYEKELNMLLVHPPENYFQELIQWTNRGLIWKFPIDNEQGLEAEQSVHFSEHVFLEGHIKDWCPKKGPIRHFMELVCVGLSKNPYMTVQEKKDHIAWFREYFGLNQELLKELNCIQDDIPVDVPKDKNLFSIAAS